MYNLKKISLLDAMQLAVAASGKSRDDIGAEMGWSPTVTNRIFSTDNYWPSLPSIPRLCFVMGNTIVADWILANAEEYLKKQPEISLDAPGLIQELGRLFKEIGDVATQAERSVEDDKLTRLEARRIIRELYDVINKAMDMIAGLRGI